MVTKYIGNIMYWPNGTWVEEELYNIQVYSFKSEEPKVLKLDYMCTECTVDAIVYGATNNEEKLNALIKRAQMSLHKMQHHMHNAQIQAIIAQELLEDAENPTK